MTDPNVRRKDLAGGLRVFSEPLAEATSVSLGVWIRAGSRDERDEVAGITHLMEHMLFKGTPDLDALGIAQAFEGIGAQENAATGEEYTVLYARFLPEHLERALDVMGDMVLRPTFADLEREREVIVEEIKMYEDRPDQMADEYLSGLIFHGDPLGRPIIGSAETVRGVDHETLRSFHQNTYTASNVFVVGAGKLDPDELEALVEAKLGGLPAGEPFARNAHPGTPQSRVHYKFKETEQYHVSVGSLGIPASSEDRFAMAALNNVFGGGMSSRLFQEVREKRGLAYSTFSFSGAYSDAGYFGMYAGCLPARTDEVVALMTGELEKLAADGIGADELRKVVGQLGGGTVLALEDTGSRMSRLGSAELKSGEFYDIDESLDRVRSVTPQQVQELAAWLAQGPVVTTIVAPTRR